MRNLYKIVVEKREGKRAFGRTRRRWEDSITMGLKRNRLRRCGLDESGFG
jgi:hypothetical protein